eukprot:COSAG06_NODE_5317_length_3567_cov_2.205882_4_plen_106_part_00
MRFPLIRQNRTIFIGNLALFWVYFYGLMGNAWQAQLLNQKVVFRTAFVGLVHQPASSVAAHGRDTAGNVDLLPVERKIVPEAARENSLFFECSFPYVCPEPVLVK